MLQKDGITGNAAIPYVGTGMMLWGIGGMLGYATFGFLADHFGRRPTIVFYNLGAIASGLVLYLGLSFNDENAGLSDSTCTALQLANFWQDVARDLGVSVAYFPAPVSQVIGTGLFWTIFLAGTAVAVSFVIGTLLGVASAWWRRGWIDTLLPSTFAFIGAFPYFWLAMVALYVLGFSLRWFPLGHAYSDDAVPGWTMTFVLDVLRHAALPIATVVLATLGGWLLSMRNTMISVRSVSKIVSAAIRGFDSAVMMSSV